MRNCARSKRQYLSMNGRIPRDISHLETDSVWSFRIHTVWERVPIPTLQNKGERERAHSGIHGARASELLPGYMYTYIYADAKRKLSQHTSRCMYNYLLGARKRGSPTHAPRRRTASKYISTDNDDDDDDRFLLIGDISMIVWWQHTCVFSPRFDVRARASFRNSKVPRARSFLLAIFHRPLSAYPWLWHFSFLDIFTLLRIFFSARNSGNCGLLLFFFLRVYF